MTQSDTYEPTAHDVLCGRGGMTNSHVGNKRFRSVVADHQREYLVAKKRDKADIARRIVSIIQSNGGMFLRKNESTGEWEEVETKKAVEKTSQALREGLDVRRKVVKSPRRNSDSAASAANEGASHKRVGKAISWDDSVPSLNEYDAGEATLPELQDEALFIFHAPPVSKEDCNYVTSV